MIFTSGLKKYNKEIQALRSLRTEQNLSPLLQGQIRQRVLSMVTEPSVVLPKALHYSFFRSGIWRFAIASIAGLLLCTGTVYASGSTSPGDALYGIKLAKEQVELTFATSQPAKAKILAKHAGNRLAELDKIKSQGKIKLSVQTETVAKAAVKDALKKLNLAKAQLQTSGDTDAATDLSERIILLKNKAKHLNVLTAEDQNQ